MIMTQPAVCASDVCFPPSRSTGKERDSESGNDYFGARYYESSVGRWLSPDWSAKEEPVPYAKLGDPQSLNLYAYVLNSPVSRFDADGHECKVCDKVEGFLLGIDDVSLFPLQNAVNHPINTAKAMFLHSMDPYGDVEDTIKVGTPRVRENFDVQTNQESEADS
jgi:RHS repeat-associated protein